MSILISFLPVWAWISFLLFFLGPLISEKAEISMKELAVWILLWPVLLIGFFLKSTVEILIKHFER